MQCGGFRPVSPLRQARPVPTRTLASADPGGGKQTRESLPTEVCSDPLGLGALHTHRPGHESQNLSAAWDRSRWGQSSTTPRMWRRTQPSAGGLVGSAALILPWVSTAHFDACAPRAFRSDHRIVGPCVPLTGAQWARIEPLLPDRTPRRGGRWRDHREECSPPTWTSPQQARHRPGRQGSRAIRDHLRKRGIKTVIPAPADQRGHRLRRGSRGGMPPL